MLLIEDIQDIIAQLSNGTRDSLERARENLREEIAKYAGKPTHLFAALIHENTQSGKIPLNLLMTDGLTGAGMKQEILDVVEVLSADQDTLLKFTMFWADETSRNRPQTQNVGDRIREIFNKQIDFNNSERELPELRALVAHHRSGQQHR